MSYLHVHGLLNDRITIFWHSASPAPRVGSLVFHGGILGRRMWGVRTVHIR